MAVLGTSFCKPAECSGEEAVTGTLSRTQNYKEKKRFFLWGFVLFLFFVNLRNLILYNYSVYNAVNLYSYSPLVEAENNCQCAFSMCFPQFVW